MLPVAHSTQNPAHLYLATLSKCSRKSISSQMRTVARLLSGNDDITLMRWAAIDRATLLALIEILRNQGKAPSTINHTLTVVRKICEEAYLLGQVSRTQYEGILRVSRDKGHRQVAWEPPSRQAVRQAIDERLKDTTLLALRDAALVATLAGAGLRKAEARATSTVDYREGVLSITGKGNKQASQPVAQATRTLIEQYLQEIPEGPLFPSWQKNDTPSSRHLSAAGIDKVVNRVLPGVTPHRLRHAYASWLAEDGHTLPVIQRLMRHSSPALTMRYIHNDDAQRAAVDSLTF